MRYFSALSGEVAEWLNAPVSKTGLPERVAGVRISPSPLTHSSHCPKPLPGSGLAFLWRGPSLPRGAHLVHVRCTGSKFMSRSTKPRCRDGSVSFLNACKALVVCHPLHIGQDTAWLLASHCPADANVFVVPLSVAKPPVVGDRIAVVIDNESDWAWAAPRRVAA